MSKQLIQIIPYSLIIGQADLKLALELAYIAPRIGGVLISGERGTGKSSAVRAFAYMMYDRVPVTLPINVTEDRVVGGWQIEALMRSDPQWQPGLLEEADGRMLYVDEVNLLDDHIVNIILDVTSTGVLSVQRESQRQEKQVSFTLVGTMNPEEGLLRPQLVDRFGLMVNVTGEKDRTTREKILQTVLDYDAALAQERVGVPSSLIREARQQDAEVRRTLEQAQKRYYEVNAAPMVEACITVASAFQLAGHRGDFVLLMAARALAALDGSEQITPDHVYRVTRLALQHRRAEAAQGAQAYWTQTDEQRVAEQLAL